MSDRVTLGGLQIRAAQSVLVRDVSIELEAGRVIALVGASGSGKTLTARAMLGLCDLDPGVVSADLAIRVGDREHRPYGELLGRGRTTRAERDRAFAEVRGTCIGYLPQDARGALDPLRRVGPQVAAAAPKNGKPPDPLPWLSRAGLPDGERVARLFPHELSGGMAQRVVIAQMLARGSRFLLADEPTSALDPTIQAEILVELKSLARQGIGLLLITHDLRVLPGFADQVWVMDSGTIVERTDAGALRDGRTTSDPARRLLDATRRIAAGRLG
jgi:peptide/nickel transport system ATP-binding protein